MVFKSTLLLCFLCTSRTTLAFLPANQQSCHQPSSSLPPRKTATSRHAFLSSWFDPKPTTTANTRQSDTKLKLLKLLREKAPRNSPTSPQVTTEILQLVRDLEAQVEEPDALLPKLAGTWELLWTAQDPSRPESRRWINPIENQSYSNNPTTTTATANTGRSSPVLPQQIQDRLEKSGIIDTSEDANEDDEKPSVVSTQSIDIKKKLVRNVVSFQVFQKRASLTVLIQFELSQEDPYRVDVKFESCRVRIPPVIDINIPLALVSPKGWLQTKYVDEDFRITRGQKGSVFLLSKKVKK